MTTTVTIEDANIFINSQSLEVLLKKFYDKGVQDALQADKSDKVTFVRLSQELKEAGRNISVITLTQRVEISGKVYHHFGAKYTTKKRA